MEPKAKAVWSTPKRIELSARQTRGGNNAGPFEFSTAGFSCYPDPGTGTGPGGS